MKKTIRTTIVTVFMLVIMLPVKAGTEEERLWVEAGEAYSGKNYEEAVEKYGQLVKKGESASLYYNYGNALFKAGYIGRAILYYERALRLDPANADIEYNLEFANLSKTDKIEKIEPFFVTEWYRGITQMFTSNIWAYASLGFFLMAMIFFLVYRFGVTIAIRKWSFGVFVICLVISIIAVGHSVYSRNMVEDNPAAIVMVGSETARSTPDKSGTEVFVIHEGTKVYIKSRLGDWIEVRLESGNVGWIENTAVEVI